MLTILNLFGRSPFAPLRAHMERVAECVAKLPELFRLLEREDWKQLENAAAEISQLEHSADLTKNDIRNHLPKTLFLPVDRWDILKILSLQDQIADQVEDIAVVATLKPLRMIESFKEGFFPFLEKNIEAFNITHSIIEELHELLESSFGGMEAEKVRMMVDEVAFREHEVDLLQRSLIHALIESESELSYVTYDLWQKIFRGVAAISNISEKLAFSVRMTLDLK